MAAVTGTDETMSAASAILCNLCSSAQALVRYDRRWNYARRFGQWF
jgi:hypothetical protein